MSERCTGTRDAAFVQTLLADSRAGATHVEEGRFRLDWTRALEKIKRFQLTDPHRYVLELVQAAVCGGATFIEVSTDADDVVLRFDGRPYAKGELGGLFDHLFTQDRERARLRQLALGINACLALQPKFVRLESGDGREGVRLQLASHTDLRLEPIPADELIAGTRIHVRDRVSWSVVLDALGRGTAECRLLAEACPHAPVPVTLNGRDLRAVLEPGALCRHRFERDGIRGELVLPPTVLPKARLLLCMNGVVIAPLEIDAPWRVLGYVDNPALTRNASHSDVVRDKELLRTTRALRREVTPLLESFVRLALVEGSVTAVPHVQHAHLQAAATALLRARTKKPLSEPLERLLDAADLVDLPLRPAARSALRPLWDAHRREGVCRVATRQFDLAVSDLPEGWAVALGPLPMLEAVFGKTTSVDQDLERVERGVANRRRREAEPREAVLNPATVLIKATLRAEQPLLHGELGLPTSWTSKDELGELTYLRAGVFLETVRPALGELRCTAIVDSPAFHPTPLWDGVVRDEVTAAVPAILEGALPQLLRKLREDFPAPPPAEALRALKRWSPEQGEVPHEPTTWALDSVAQLARRYIDALLLQAPRLTAEQAPWLWDWPLACSLDGGVLSLAAIAQGDEREAIHYVVELPWESTG